MTSLNPAENVTRNNRVSREKFQIELKRHLNDTIPIASHFKEKSLVSSQTSNQLANYTHTSMF